MVEFERSVRAPLALAFFLSMHASFLGAAPPPLGPVVRFVEPAPLGELVDLTELDRKRLFAIPYLPLSTRPDLVEALPKYAAALNELRRQLGAPNLTISEDRVRIVNKEQIELVGEQPNSTGLSFTAIGLVFLNGDLLSGGRSDSYVMAHEMTHYFFPLAVNLNHTLLEGSIDLVARDIFQKVLWQSHPEEPIQRAKYSRNPVGPDRLMPNEYCLDSNGGPFVFGYWEQSRAVTHLDRLSPQFFTRFLKYASGVDSTPLDQIISDELGKEWLPLLSKESKTKPSEIIAIAESVPTPKNCAGWLRRLRRRLFGG